MAVEARISAPVFENSIKRLQVLGVFILGEGRTTLVTMEVVPHQVGAQPHLLTIIRQRA
jgi:hypothetical protein